MRKQTALIASGSAIVGGAVGMAVTARLAPHVSLYLLAPAPGASGPILVIERVAFVALLLGLPSFGLAASSVVMPPRLLLPVRISGLCLGLICACLLLLGTVWGTASSAEVLPIDTALAHALGTIGEVLLVPAVIVGTGATVVTLSRISRTPESHPS